eukprot:6432907-Lingulodinium_polyedra.AAC.1
MARSCGAIDFDDEAERHPMTCAKGSGHSQMLSLPWTTQNSPFQCATVLNRTRVMCWVSCF